MADNDLKIKICVLFIVLRKILKRKIYGGGMHATKFVKIDEINLHVFHLV